MNWVKKKKEEHNIITYWKHFAVLKTVGKRTEYKWYAYYSICRQREKLKGKTAIETPDFKSGTATKKLQPVSVTTQWL